MSETRFQCQFCGHRFVHEDRFIKHRCKQMIRDEEFRSTEGQAAWLYYQKWMKAYRRLVPNSKAFLTSKYFNSFYRFAKFVKAAKIPDVDVFISLMKDRDISPTIWTNDQVYSLYLEYIDRKMTPLRHVEITINTLFDLADDKDVNIDDIFSIVTPNEIIQLLRQRKLSPWFLLNSAKFKEFFINKTTSEEKIVMESIIRPKYWKDRFDSGGKILTQIQFYASELHL